MPMTKTYCDKCGEMILSCKLERTISLSEEERPGETAGAMSVPRAWKATIKVERIQPGFDACQHCLDDVMERAFKLFLETRSTKRG